MKTDNELFEEKDLIDTFMGRSHSRPGTGHKFIGYHNNWDMLHNVIDTIKNVDASRHPDFTSVNWRRQVIDMPISSDLESVYNKVVKFIKAHSQKV